MRTGRNRAPVFCAKAFLFVKAAPGSPVHAPENGGNYGAACTMAMRPRRTERSSARSGAAACRRIPQGK
ncbi:MAG: hypothetical protein JXR49_17475 [Acidobacteria bacterium]|nr:hypothetical protein [Acidobacteriota bacterium]